MGIGLTQQWIRRTDLPGFSPSPRATRLNLLDSFDGGALRAVGRDNGLQHVPSGQVRRGDNPACERHRGLRPGPVRRASGPSGARNPDGRHGRHVLRNASSHEGVEELLEVVSACPEDVVGVIYKEIFSALEEDFDYIVTVSDHGELLGEHHGMWNHVSGIYPELTHVPLVISGLKEEDCDSTVNILDLYTTILELAGVDSNQDDSQNLTSPRDSRTYLTEYGVPFDRNLERAKSEGLDLDEYDRDLFAFAESGHYGYKITTGGAKSVTVLERIRRTIWMNFWAARK